MNPRGLDGIVYYALHMLSLLFILSFLGVVFLRLIRPVREYLMTPWDLFTPPFSASVEREEVELNQEIVKKAQLSSLGWISLGITSSFFLSMIGIVPWRNGTMYTGLYEAIAPTVTIPEIIYQLPILSDLTFLGDYISSPDAFGYILISVTMAFMILGFWNVTFLFYHRVDVYGELESNSSWFIQSLRWMPRTGLFLYSILALEFGVLWFL